MKIKHLSILILLSCIWTSSFSQTGGINVTVVDGETGETIIGANVVIAGTTTGNVTDLDGKASIRGLNPGKYNIQTSFVSYQTQKIEGLEVRAGETTTAQVSLMTEEIGLSEVVITAAAMKSSENAIMLMQKKSVNVFDAITSEQFSRLGDSDAAAAAKRVVGVTIEGGKYIYIRGLGDRYSKSLLNGAELPGLDPNRNTVQMDLFPSNLIDNIIVYKTFSPDLTGEFAGGLVDITTKDFPEQFTLQAAASLGFNDQASFNDQFLTYQGSGTDWLGFDNGLRSLPDQLVGINESEFPSASRLGLPSQNGGIITQQDVTNTSRAFDNLQFNPMRKAQTFNRSFSLSLGNQKELFGKPLGFIAGATYSRNFNYYNNGTVNRYQGLTSNQTAISGSDLIFSNKDEKSTDEVTLGLVLNTAYKLNLNNKIGIDLMFNQAGTKETRYLDGYRLDNSVDSTNLNEIRVLSWMERSLKNGRIFGEHNFPSLGNVKIDWFTSYTLSSMDQPDLRFFSNNILLNGDDRSYIVNNRNRPGRYFRTMEEINWDSRLNIVIPAKVWNGLEGKFKTGFAYTFRDREFREDRYEFFVNPRNYDGNIDNLITKEKLGYSAEGIQMTTIELFTQSPNNYDADQAILSGYLMAELPFTSVVKMTAGVRYETNPFRHMFIRSGDEELEIETLDDALLPSINFTYNMSENTNLRASYGKTLARPTFRESAPLVTFAFPGEFDQIGNPGLKQTKIDNFDLRWETFPRRGEYIGISAFYKKFVNPIENTINPNAGGSAKEYKYENVDQATVLGAEIEIKKDLDFISPALENFRIATNAAYIFSEVSLEADELASIQAFDPAADDTREMFNQSPFVFNASLMYDNANNGISSNLTYNIFGSRLKFFQTDLPFIYEQPRPELNFSIKKQLNDRSSIRLRSNNLLNADYQEIIKFKGVEYDFNRYKSGRTFSISYTYLIER